MRHGKAEEGLNKADYKRKLAEKGVRRNQRVGTLLLEREGKFEALLCSDAARTKETAEQMAKIFDFPKGKIHHLKEFYLAHERVMLSSLYALNNNIKEILLVGHNPGVSELVTSLTGEIIDWMPTSALIAIQIDADHWEDISNVPSKISYSLNPKS